MIQQGSIIIFRSALGQNIKKYMGLRFENPFRSRKVLLRQMFSFNYIIVMLLLVISMSGCGKTNELKKENWYQSAVWSPDGQQVAYFKRYLEFTPSTPLINFFIGEGSSENTIQKDMVVLCLNDKNGQKEVAIKNITYPLMQKDKYTISSLYSTISWREDGIYYGISMDNYFTTGVYRILPDGTNDQLIQGGTEAINKTITGPAVMQGLELYSNSGNYGRFTNRAIFIFDHNRKDVSVFVKDPELKQVSNPPYKVTGK
jgi:hypothetical protein